MSESVVTACSLSGARGYCILSTKPLHFDRLSLSADGQWLATSNSTPSCRKIAIFDLPTSTENLVIDAHNNWMGEMAFRANHKQLAFAAGESLVKVLNIELGELVASTMATSEGVSYGLVCTPDGKFPVTVGCIKNVPVCCKKGKVKIFDADTFQTVKVFLGHTAALFSMALSPDGTRIVTGSYLGDQSMRVRARVTGAELQNFAGPTSHVGNVAFDRNSILVATSRGDWKMIAWDAISGAEHQNLEANSNVRSERRPDLRIICSDGRILFLGTTIWSELPPIRMTELARTVAFRFDDKLIAPPVGTIRTTWPNCGFGTQAIYRIRFMVFIEIASIWSLATKNNQ